MPKPAFLVEGLMEKRIIQRLCPGNTVAIVYLTERHPSPILAEWARGDGRPGSGVMGRWLRNNFLS